MWQIPFRPWPPTTSTLRILALAGDVRKCFPRPPRSRSASVPPRQAPAYWRGLRNTCHAQVPSVNWITSIGPGKALSVARHSEECRSARPQVPGLSKMPGPAEMPYNFLDIGPAESVPLAQRRRPVGKVHGDRTPMRTVPLRAPAQACAAPTGLMAGFQD